MNPLTQTCYRLERRSIGSTQAVTAVADPPTCRHRLRGPLAPAPASQEVRVLGARGISVAKPQPAETRSLTRQCPEWWQLRRPVTFAIACVAGQTAGLRLPGIPVTRCHRQARELYLLESARGQSGQSPSVACLAPRLPGHRQGKQGRAWLRPPPLSHLYLSASACPVCPIAAGSLHSKPRREEQNLDMVTLAPRPSWIPEQGEVAAALNVAA